MSILEEASELINGDRARDYGPVCENFERIADFWTTYIGGVEPLTPFDVANMMILVKVARQKTGSAGGLKAAYHRDSVVDIAGYAALAERCRNEIDEAMQPFELRDDLEDYIAEHPELGLPRVWDEGEEVADGVVVKDSEGDFWHFSDGIRYLWWESNRSWDGMRSSDNKLDCYGPVTEVLDWEGPLP